MLDLDFLMDEAVAMEVVTKRQLDEALEDLHNLKRYADLSDTSEARWEVEAQERRVAQLRRTVAFLGR